LKIDAGFFCFFCQASGEFIDVAGFIAGSEIAPDNLVADFCQRGSMRTTSSRSIELRGQPSSRISAAAGSDSSKSF
jgi:hypothetical protein